MQILKRFSVPEIYPPNPQPAASEVASEAEDCNPRASGPQDQAEYEQDLRGSRRLAYSIIVLALVFYVGISWGMGWGVFRG